jgi:pyruvate dehydrogenase E2 component (dihydrolipoamide acetyltransferase)
MAKEFRLPDIGEGLTEAEVVRWLIPVGERVAVDQPVVEVETDKAVVELPSPFAGIVLHHGAAPGEVIEVGAVLVVVGEAGEAWGEPSTAPAAETAAAAEAAPIVGTLAAEAEDLTAAEPHLAPIWSKRVEALPVVRKLAKDLGVDLRTVAGTGPEGRISREDVVAAAEATGRVPGPAAPEPATVVDTTAAAGEAAVTEAAEPAAPVPPEGAERRPLSKLRRTIAANMTRSWTEIPRVTTFDEVDGTRLLAARRALEGRHGSPVPLDALVVKAVLPALAAFPEFNATLDGDDLVLHRRRDIGVAVDTPDGLLVAVVKGADRLSLLDLAREVLRLAGGAKERRLAPAELTGQTFTVSNIGAIGGGLGTPIVPHGTTGILSVGRGVDRPVARNGRVEIAPMIPLSLSYDHRVIDGGLGRRFIAMVVENLAEPALFLAG